MLTQPGKINFAAMIATLTGILPILFLIFIRHKAWLPEHTVEIYLAMILIYITGVHWGFAYQDQSLSHLAFSLIASLTPMAILFIQALQGWSETITCISLLGALAFILAFEHVLPVSRVKKDFLRLRVTASLFLAASTVTYLICT